MQKELLKIKKYLPLTTFDVSFRDGQSIVELLVAVAVGTIAMLGIVLTLSPALKTSSDSSHLQITSGLAKQLLDNVRVAADANWHSIDVLSSGSGNRYYLVTANSPFSVVAGVENVVLATTTYSRSFYVTAVGRDGSNKIVLSGGSDDPSTKLITVVASSSPNIVRSMTMYITRSRDMVFDQTDWSGGWGQAGPITSTSTNSQFATSTNIDYATTTGSIRINGL